MEFSKLSVALIISFSVLHGILLQSRLCSAAHASGVVRKFEFVLSGMKVTRLCKNNTIIAVNGRYPGPTVRITDGDNVIVKVINRSIRNATIHWHGIKQIRNSWADGPEYVTQCPIVPGSSYVYNFTVKDQHGTLWWHAHSSWLRATVYGAIIIDPKPGTRIPYPKPDSEQTLLLGDYYKTDPIEIIDTILSKGILTPRSNALTINAQPGDLLPCSNSRTFKFKVTKGETVLLRVINAAINTDMFLGVAKHKLKVVATDANYVKPFKTGYIMIGPGQTMDLLLTANRQPCSRYYVGAYAFYTFNGSAAGNTTATAILEYTCPDHDADSASASASTSPLPFPKLPAGNDTTRGERFVARPRSLYSGLVPRDVDVRLMYTLNVDAFRCPNKTCEGGPVGQMFAASISNYSFQLPATPILHAHYFNISGVYTTDFPDYPQVVFNFTDMALQVASNLLITSRATKTRVLPYNSRVELVLQGTALLAGLSHPIHLHGYDFFVLATGRGNYNASSDPAKFNLVDPQIHNTVNVPLNGWAVIRFVADNPGTWFLHCHFDGHNALGLGMVFIVEDGPTPDTKLFPPPADLLRC